jgi:hypothetical protein
MSPTTRERKQRRWLWLLGGLVVALAIALVIVVISQNDDSDTASSPTTSTAAATTTSAAATTTTAPATTTTTIPYPAITADPQVYAQYLFVAWQNNGQSAAAQVASSEAISQMFQQAYASNTGWQFGSCDPAAGTLYCTWNAASGSKITMQVRTLTGGQPIQVVGVSRS